MDFLRNLFSRFTAASEPAPSAHTRGYRVYEGLLPTIAEAGYGTFYTLPEAFWTDAAGSSWLHPNFPATRFPDDLRTMTIMCGGTVWYVLEGANPDDYKPRETGPFILDEEPAWLPVSPFPDDFYNRTK